MAKPERHYVDYFPFFAKRGKTLNILQSKYGLEGIGFFTNLMRFLALTPDHYYCVAEESDRLNFFAEIGMTDEDRGTAMIELMVKTGKLDKELWVKYKVIACEAFLKSLVEAYRKRSNKLITIEQIKTIFEKNNVDDVSSAAITHNSAVIPAVDESDDDNAAVIAGKEEKSKEEKSKENEKKENSFSLQEKLNPSFGDFSQRLEKLRAKYNDFKIGPPFKKTALNLSPSESSDLMKIMAVYDDLAIIDAMKNYGKITNSADYDPGGCVYHGFVSFMVRGAEKYCDEANPYEAFRRKNGVINQPRSPPKSRIAADEIPPEKLDQYFS